MTFRHLLISMLFVTGCTYGTRPPHQSNAPAKKGTFDRNVVRTPEDSQATVIAAAPDTEDPMSESLVRDASKRSQRSAIATLDRFNQRILLGAGNSVESDLVKFGKILTLGCEADLKGCLALDYLSQSPNSYRVAMLLAQRSEKQVSTYYRLIKLAYMIKPSRFDFKLAEMTLLHADAADEPGINHLIQTVLSEIGANASPEQARRALKLFSPFTFSRRSTSGSAELNFSKVFEMAAQFGIFYDENGALDKDLLKIIAQNQLQNGSVLSRYKALPRKIGLSAPVYNESLFLLDRLATSDLSKEDAQALWRGVRGDQRHLQLLQSSEMFVRTLFQSYVSLTNQKAKNVFSKPIPSEAVLEYALAHSNETIKLWQGFQKTLAPMSAFVLAVLKAEHAEKSIIQRATALFEGVDKNIKYGSVYPQMLMLTYTMSKKDFEKQYRGFFGSINVSSSKLAENIFAGLEEPWFGYSSDRTRLTAEEVLFALDVGVRTGALESFGIDPESYAEQMLIKLSGKMLVQVENFAAFTSRIWANSQSMSELRQACSDLRAGRPFKNKMTADEILISPFLGHRAKPWIGLDGGLFNGKSTNETETGVSVFGLYPAEEFEVMRNDLPTTERKMRGILEILKNTYPHLKFAAAERELSRVENVKQKMSAQFSSFFKTYNECLRQLIATEFDVGTQLVKAEDQHLRQVHRDLKALRATSDPARIARIQSKYVRRLGGRLSSDRLEPDGLLYNSYDFAFRLARYLKHGLVTDTVNINAINPSIDVNLEGDLTDMNIFVSNNQRQVYFDEYEGEFVRQGLRVAFSGSLPFARWYVGTFYSRASMLAILLKGVPAIYKASESAISPREIIDTYKRWIETYQMSDDERNYFAVLGLRRKYNLLHLSEIFYRTDAQKVGIIETYGILDFALDSMQQEVYGNDLNNLLAARDGGDLRPVVHVGPRKSARAYYNIRSTNQKRMYIEISSRLDSFLYRSFRDPIVQDAEKIEMFYQELVKEAEHLESVPESLRPRFDLDVDRSTGGAPLSPQVRENYEKTIRHFHNATFGCFRPETTTCTWSM